MDVTGDWARVQNGRAQFRGFDGQWFDVATPEHAESLSYVQAAVDNPEVDALVAFRAQGGKLTNEQAAFFSNPLVGLDSFGQGQTRSWGAVNLYDDTFSPQQAGALAQFGGASFLSASDLQRGLAFNESESPAAQAARNSDDGFGGFLGIAALALAAYTGGASLMEYFGAESAGYLAAADASAGLVAGGEIAGAGFSTFATNYFSPSGSDLLSAFSGNFQSVDSLASAAVASGGTAIPDAVVSDLVLSDAATGGGFSLSQLTNAANTIKSTIGTAQQVAKLAGGSDTKGLAAASYRGGSVPAALSGVIPSARQLAASLDPKTGLAAPAPAQVSSDTSLILFVLLGFGGLYLLTKGAA